MFHYYNLMYTEGHKNSVRFEFARNVAMQKEPGIASKCIGCGKCEQHCPQHISIRDMLKKADRKLRPAPYRIGIAAARKLTGR